MAIEKKQLLRIYYNDDLLARAEAGDHNFTNRLRKAFEPRGFKVRLCRNSAAARHLSAVRSDWCLFHMDRPLHKRALTMRLAYFYPFWRIEKSAKRWEWDIAQQSFDPESVDQKKAEKFGVRLRKRQFGKDTQPGIREGLVYVPLQGKLLTQRSFQSMRPVDMVEQTLAHSGPRRVVVGLHPKETYGKAERQALDTLTAAHPRLEIVERQTDTLLRECDFVVTQNSSVALSAAMLEKPAILFAKTDFHHIGLNVLDLGVEACFRQIADHRPDFAAYLYWFLKLGTINAGAPDAEDQIVEAVRRHNWPVSS